MRGPLRLGDIAVAVDTQPYPLPHNDFSGTKRHLRQQKFEGLLEMAGLDKERVVYLLNRILEEELAGVIRYTHYSFPVFGHNRIPIVSWMCEQAAESLTHAQQAGEMITLFGEYPSLAIGQLLDSPQHDVDAIMRESLWRAWRRRVTVLSSHHR